MNKKYIILYLAIISTQSKAMDLGSLSKDLYTLEQKLISLIAQLSKFSVPLAPQGAPEGGVKIPYYPQTSTPSPAPIPTQPSATATPASTTPPATTTPTGTPTPLPPRETPAGTPVAKPSPTTSPTTTTTAPTTRPVRRPVATPAPVFEVTIPKITFKNLRGLDAGNLQPLERMPKDTEQKKAEQKAQAKGILNGLLAFVKSPQYKQEDQNKIIDAIKRILAIDPLLISTAAIILREAKVPMKENYELMGDLYHERIRDYVATELDNILKRKGGGTIHKGLRDDIDEALSYPIELEGEIQKAKMVIELQPGTQQAREAQEFIKRINDLREWLLELLKKNKNTLKASGLDVDFYIDLFEEKGNRVYCITQVGGGNPPENVYIPFIIDLKNIAQEIDDYKTNVAHYSKSKKISKQQDIINKLKGFLAYATDRQYCQLCLTQAIREIRRENERGTFDINETFRKIRTFLTSIYDQEQNEAIKDVLDNTLPKLRDAIIAKGCPIRE
jgi:hypothetical protein